MPSVLIIFEGGLKMAEMEMNFPDIREALYTGHSIEEIRSLYINDLRTDGSLYSMLYANKLEEAKTMLSSKNLHQLEGEFHGLKDCLRSWTKTNNVHCLLKRRQKDWLGLNEKIQLYFLKGKSLSKLLDLLGFRVVICNEVPDTINSIKLCYTVLNVIIDFFVNSKHCLLLEAEPLLDTDFSPEEHPEIIVPEKSFMDSSLRNNVKDYIIQPKWNGYQSLHVILRRPNGLTFEVQVRTYAMDLLAEYGSGEHTKYKEERYSEINLNIDYSKINIPGFKVLPGNKINDIVGLRKSIDPFNFL